MNAPKLSNFVCGYDLPQISLGAAVNNITMIGTKPNMICYARAKLPSFMPTVEKLTVESHCEVCDIFYIYALTLFFSKNAYYYCPVAICSNTYIA